VNVLFEVLKIGINAPGPPAVEGIPEIVKVVVSTMLAIANPRSAVVENVIPIASAEVFPIVSVTVVELVVQVALYVPAKVIGVCDAEARIIA
jgi:hypothetical protein